MRSSKIFEDQWIHEEKWIFCTNPRVQTLSAVSDQILFNYDKIKTMKIIEHSTGFLEDSE